MTPSDAMADGRGSLVAGRGWFPAVASDQQPATSNGGPATEYR
jgi:hypothetical protein